MLLSACEKHDFSLHFGAVIAFELAAVWDRVESAAQAKTLSNCFFVGLFFCCFSFYVHLAQSLWKWRKKEKRKPQVLQQIQFRLTIEKRSLQQQWDLEWKADHVTNIDPILLHGSSVCLKGDGGIKETFFEGLKFCWTSYYIYGICLKKCTWYVDLFKI